MAKEFSVAQIVLVFFVEKKNDALFVRNSYLLQVTTKHVAEFVRTKNVLEQNIKMKEEYIKGELLHLQAIYDLGDVHVFRSSEKGFHAISFAKLTAKEYLEILQNSSCDLAFKNIPRYTSYRNWVLRQFSKGKTKKPKYLYTLKRKTKRQHSLAHYKFIYLLYPKINQSINSDSIEELTVIDYATGSNVD